jgi:hypothetical protein
VAGLPRGHGPAAVARARQLLELGVVQLDGELLDAATTLDDGVLRSLDAIQLAAAQVLAEDVTASY